MKERLSGPDFSQRPWLFALLAVLLVLVTEQTIEHLALGRALEQERVAVLTQLSALRARLEGVINANLLLVHGLTAVISAHPNMDQEEFARIAQGLVDERHALRNIAGAPDMVVSLMYRRAGNEAAIGLDYRTHPTQGPAALRALRTGQPALAGPLPLLQGGTGIIIREPVFITPATPDAERRPWGIVSAVIDVDTLYRQAGILDALPQLRLALRGTDGSGPGGPLFFGDSRVAAQQPVTLNISVPGGAWQLAATPTGGWGQSLPLPWLIRLAGALIALAAGVMTYLLVRGNLELARSQGRLRALLDTIPDLVWLKDPNGVYLACNPRFEQFFGAREADILGKRDHDFVPDELAEFFRAKDRDAIAAGAPSVNEEWLTFASDGHRGLFETIKSPLRDAHGRLLGVLGIARDITAHNEAEERIRGLMRVHAVLSGINGAIVRLRDRDTLFREACRIAVEVGGFRMAWLGLSDPESGEVRPVAHAGQVGDYLDRLHVSLGDDEHSHGPTGLALRQGRHVVCNDIAQDPRMAPWREAALALNYRASAAFPIMVEGRTLGTFNLYAEQAQLFDTAELDLLDELAADIGFALELMESDRAREALNQRIIELLESMSDGFVSLGCDWRFQYVNRQAGVLLGRNPEELVGEHIWTAFPESFGQPTRDALERAMQARELVQLEDYFAPWDRWFENRVYPTSDGISSFFTDITERKRNEQELRRQRDILDRTSRLAKVGGWEFEVSTLEGSWTDETARIQDMEPSPCASVATGLDLFQGPSRAAIEQAVRAAIAEGQPYELELEMTTAKGARKWVRTIGLPVLEDGRVVRVQGAIQDITTRKLAEREARRREAMLDTVFQVLPDLFFLMDPDGTILDYRASRSSDLYVSPEHFLGRRMGDVLPPAAAEIFERNLALAANEHRLVTYEYDLHMPDGNRRFEARLNHLPDTAQLIAVVRDMTERTRTEAALEAQRRETDLLATLLERSRQPMAVGFPDGRLGRVNQAFLDLIGHSREEIDQIDWGRDLTPPEWLDVELAALEQTHRTGQPVRYEKEYVRKDGQRIPVELYVHELKDASGAVDYYYAFVTDITERKRAELALRESESRYRHLFEHNPAPMLIYERGSLHLLSVNESFLDHYGYSREEAEALRLTDLYPPEERRPIVDLAARLSGLAYVGEWHHLKKDGAVITIEARSHDLDYQGRSARVAVVTDITERKRIEDAVHRLNAELEERVLARTAELATANKELETFTYSVSHDLKAPLRGIDGYSRLLLEDHLEQLDEEGRLFLHNVRQGVDQMSQLIEDLLAYSRMERRGLQGIPVDLAGLMARILAEREDEIQDSGATLRVELTDLIARADPDGLAMVLRNLVDNALKFHRPDESPVIEIQGQAREDSVMLTIRDQGIGFDMRFHDRIFEIFQRLQRAEDYPGTGIGLAIVRKAVQRMGGSVRAESAPGQGATFFLELPR